MHNVKASHVVLIVRMTPAIHAAALHDAQVLSHPPSWFDHRPSFASDESASTIPKEVRELTGLRPKPGVSDSCLPRPSGTEPSTISYSQTRSCRPHRTWDALSVGQK